MLYNGSDGKDLVSSPWCLIQIPSGFDVIDMVLVNVSASPEIDGIQITQSVKPFTTHHTFDTCPPKTKERLEKLWVVILNHFGMGDSAEMFYLMLAPNCKGDDIKPPSGHSSDFTFLQKLLNSLLR
jgi:hypothetical protein